MMSKFFKDDYIITRYTESSGGWGDGVGSWQEVDSISGHMRTLGADERMDIAEITTTHRLYTHSSNVEHGDRIVRGDKTYRVTLLDHKSIPTSKLDFYQIDCELVI